MALTTKTMKHLNYPLTSLLLFISISFCTSSKQNKIQAICEVSDKPPKEELEMTARWMVHYTNWGVISTISTRDLNLDDKNTTTTNSNSSSPPVPFGNIVSFTDGPCKNSTGTPYFYVTAMDQTMIDISQNPHISLTISEMSFDPSNLAPVAPSCSYTPYGDPENPPCARLTLTGTFERVVEGSDEHEFAFKALMDRHPVMSSWPAGHEFFVGKLVVKDLWLLDYFGGAPVTNLEEYFKVTLPEETTGKKEEKEEEEEEKKKKEEKKEEETKGHHDDGHHHHHDKTMNSMKWSLSELFGQFPWLQ